MTARLRVLLVCTLLCTVLVAPAVGGTPSTAGHAQTEGPAPEPDIAVNTSSIDFGEVDVGETATATVTVRNDGEGTLRVKDLELGGDDAFSLALDDSASSGAEGAVATSPNFTLEPDESEQVTVVFEPSSEGSYSGTLAIDSDDRQSPTVGVALFGDGRQPTPPEIAVDPQSLSFENATVGERSVRNVTVSNTGTGELLVSDQSIQPTGGDFELLTPLDAAIPPGESDTLSVAFEPTSRNATDATLSLSTNAPNGTTVVYLTSSRATADVSVNRTDNTTELTATVRNATAGDPVSVPVPSDPDDPASTDVDSVSVTPTRDGSFDLNISSADERPAGASAFDAPDSTEPDELGYINVTHSIPNENISQATIRYRVNQSRMDELEAEPEDFSLYRRVNGTWERVNTTFEREQNGTFVFSGTASGLSEWTAATEVPRISVTDATANVTAITLEESVEIQVLLNNTGGSDGRFEVELLQNGTVVERRDVAVSPSTTSLVTFQRGFDQTGTYGIEVNDIFVAAVEVSDGEADVVEGGETSVDASGESESSGGPGPLLLGGAVAVLGLVGLAGFGAYRLLGSRGGPDDAGGGPAVDPSDAPAGDAESDIGGSPTAPTDGERDGPRGDTEPATPVDRASDEAGAQTAPDDGAAETSARDSASAPEDQSGQDGDAGSGTDAGPDSEGDTGDRDTDDGGEASEDEAATEDNTGATELASDDTGDDAAADDTGDDDDAPTDDTVETTDSEGTDAEPGDADGETKG